MADRTSDFKKGLCIELDGKIYVIVDFQHVKPGKGPAFVRTKLRDVAAQRIHEKTFTAGVPIRIVHLRRRAHQFLYNDGEGYHFMDSQSNEMVTIPKTLIERPELLKEGQEEVELLIQEETGVPLVCQMPFTVSLEVTYAEPGIRGDTVNRPTEEATLETGHTIRVPLFIETGDIIRVDTRNGQYVERERNA